MSLLAELKDSLLLGDSGDIRNTLTMHNLIEQVHNLGFTIAAVRGSEESRIATRALPIPF